MSGFHPGSRLLSPTELHCWSCGHLQAGHHPGRGHVPHFPHPPGCFLLFRHACCPRGPPFRHPCEPRCLPARGFPFAPSELLREQLSGDSHLFALQHSLETKPKEAKVEVKEETQDVVSTPVAAPDRPSLEASDGPGLPAPNLQDVVSTPVPPTPSSSVVEVMATEESPWARRQFLMAIKEEAPDASIASLARANRHRPSLPHHMLADTVTLLKDLVSGEPLPQTRSLQVLGTGARRRVYEFEPGLVLKLTSEEMGHGLEPAWCDKFLPLTCKVHAHGQCSVRLSESASTHQEATMSWLIQERFEAHMKDYVPQVGPGSPTVVQLLACFVCVKSRARAAVSFSLRT